VAANLKGRDMMENYHPAGGYGERGFGRLGVLVFGRRLPNSQFGGIPLVQTPEERKSTHEETVHLDDDE
jgi:hypothetical protein